MLATWEFVLLERTLQFVSFQYDVSIMFSFSLKQENYIYYSVGICLIKSFSCGKEFGCALSGDICIGNSVFGICYILIGHDDFI